MKMKYNDIPQSSTENRQRYDFVQGQNQYINNYGNYV